MLKSRLGNYSIIIDGTWCEISYKGEVVKYGNTEDQMINAEKILLTYIVKDMKELRKEGKEIVQKWINQFDDKELKTVRIAYAENADSSTLELLAQGGYTVESYINSL